jgi:hypothetical protein
MELLSYGRLGADNVSELSALLAAEPADRAEVGQ